MAILRQEFYTCIVPYQYIYFNIRVLHLHCTISISISKPEFTFALYHIIMSLLIPEFNPASYHINMSLSRLEFCFATYQILYLHATIFIYLFLCLFSGSAECSKVKSGLPTVALLISCKKNKELICRVNNSGNKRFLINKTAILHF